MDDFANILDRGYGLKPQGKAAPIGVTRGNGSGSGAENGSGREGGMARAGRNGSFRGSVLDQDSDEFGDDLFGLGSNGNVKPAGGRSDVTLDPFGLSSGYDDVFGGPPKYSSPNFPSMSNHDDIFRVQPAMSKSANSPLFDTPVYDDDIFGGVPGTRISAGVFDDVFTGGSAAPSVSLFDDLLGGYSAGERNVSRTPRASSPVRSSAPEERDSIFDDLLSGVSSMESSKPRWSTEAKPPQHPESRAPVEKATPAEDAASFVDPIISIMKQTSFPWMNESQNGMSEDINVSTPADNDAVQDEKYYQPTYESYFPKASRSVKEGRWKDIGSSRLDSSIKDRFEGPDGSSNSGSPPVVPQADTIEAAYFPNLSRTARDRKQSDIGGSTSNLGSVEGYGFPSFEPNEAPPPVQLETDMEQTGGEDWLTIDEVRLVTAPSAMPPPSRQAPSLPYERQKFSSQTDFQSEQNISDYKSEPSSHSQNAAEDLLFYRQSGPSSLASGVENDVMAAAAARGIDGLEDFMSGVLNKSRVASWPQEEVDGTSDGGGYQGELKDRMNRGVRLAKEAREKGREEKQKEAKIARAAAKERDGKEAREQILRDAREKQEREREKQEKERQAKEEKEREKQKKERVREREREREKDRAAERAAVERATAEARERAVTEARERAERAAVERAAAEARERAAIEAKERADRAAVERAAAEARERAAAEAKDRAERAAVERAAAEARERGAAEARERAERAAAERVATEARERAERAAVERATAEARERAVADARARAAAELKARAERAAAESVAAEARERAAERAAAEARERAERAAAEKARENQRQNDNDLDRLFNMTTRANSEPRQRRQNFDFTSDQRTSQPFGSEGQQGRPPSSAPGVKKVPSATNIDDWTSLFAPTPQDEFQEIEGETPDRRRARLERHQRTKERAAKALADKNQRDLNIQFEQAEKQRAGEVLDTEIRRWAAGKEGNLRALLSTLQYVLWPECGWQPISLTDVISAIAVKKAYRKATLCVHPDKVQQKGATVQQKYIAEKVFDLLKEAWNKFNSEELF